MNLTTKGDLVLAALRKLGVASNATLTDVEPQSMEDGVNDLEMMMAEWLGGDASPGINVGYIFADADVAPDPGDEHGLSNNAINAVIFNLACRIAPDYALEASAKLITTARYGKERLVKLSAMDRAKAAKCKSGYQTVCLLVAVISWRSGTVGITSTGRNLAITGANKCRFSNFRS